MRFSICSMKSVNFFLCKLFFYIFTIIGRPPIQLTLNTMMIKALGPYLATGDGQFLTVYGTKKEESEGNNFDQLQIIPIPDIQSLVYSERFVKYLKDRLKKRLKF